MGLGWRTIFRILAMIVCTWMAADIGAVAFGQQSPVNPSSQVARAIGTIKSIQPGAITLATDSGGELTATITPTTKILRVAPGQKDLKDAAPLVVSDLQAGDRVLVRGQSSPDSRTMAALAVIVMKQSDVSAKQEREREDWQRKGVGGLVETVDAASGNIIITTGGFGGAHEVVIHTASSTILRRYAPDSVKFDEAKPAPLAQIHAGDQLRARGARSAEGNELTAEEVVSGTFRNIAGTITSIDSAANSLTVQDVIGKSPVVVRFSPDSQMKKLPPEMAQRIAMRLKAGTGEGPQPGVPAGSARGSGTAPGSMPGAGGGLAGRGNGAPDFQRFLGRLPSSNLSDLQKGEAVMIVSTRNEGSQPVTAITMLAGVDAILRASPSSASTILSPWSLGPGGAEGEAGP